MGFCVNFLGLKCGGEREFNKFLSHKNSVKCEFSENLFCKFTAKPYFTGAKK